MERPEIEPVADRPGAGGGSGGIEVRTAGPEIFERPDVIDLFGDRAEGPDFLTTLGTGDMVRMASVIATAGGETIAAGTQFSMQFDMALTSPAMGPTLRAMRRVFPRAGTFGMHGLGAIHTGEPQVVVSGRLPPAERDAAFAALVRATEAEGARQHCVLHMVADIAEEEEWAGAVLRRMGYHKAESMPMTWLPLPSGTMQDYLASRSHDFRKTIRKALAPAFEAIEVSETRTITPELDAEMEALTRQLQAQSRTQAGGLELMPEGFHRRLAERAPDRVVVLLYRLGGRLVGFGYLIGEGEAILGKTLGLSFPEARDYNLVHFNLYKSIELAIRLGKRWLVIGQAGYPTKLKFGARLVRRYNYLKGRGLARPMLALSAGSLDRTSIARQWRETSEPRFYFSANPQLPFPPIKRIWVAGQQVQGGE